VTGHAESVPPVLAIDGPSGTGKGTIAGRVAEQLGWHILDSGALYRAIGFLAVENHIEPNDIRALRVLAESSVVEFSSTPTGVNILVDQRDITEEVRSESGAKNASIYAKIPALREALLKRQRALRAHPGLVADGRDMGTVVFPDAFLKVFLDASASVRAERRHNQLREKGFDVKLRGLEREIAERDEQDRKRAVSPLVPAVDAIVLDTSTKDIAQVFTDVMQLVDERLVAKRFTRA
tara:strand:- start:72 stop:782 length:711 start_codon:yes stop_codon:yes gene_type:complete